MTHYLSCFVLYLCTLFTTLYFSGPCNHTACCAYCAYRQRVFLNLKKCGICSKTLSTVIFTSEPLQSFQDYSLSSFSPSSVDSANGIYYDSPTIQHSITKLQAPRCPQCHKHLASKSELKKHVISNHNSQYWYATFFSSISSIIINHYSEICLQTQPLFLSEFNVYSSTQLLQHYQTHFDSKIEQSRIQFAIFTSPSPALPTLPL